MGEKMRSRRAIYLKVGALKAQLTKDLRALGDVPARPLPAMAQLLGVPYSTLYNLTQYPSLEPSKRFIDAVTERYGAASFSRFFEHRAWTPRHATKAIRSVRAKRSRGNDDLAVAA
jgi:hypothetical protein